MGTRQQMGPNAKHTQLLIQYQLSMSLNNPTKQVTLANPPKEKGISKITGKPFKSQSYHWSKKNSIKSQPIHQREECFAQYKNRNDKTYYENETPKKTKPNYSTNPNNHNNHKNIKS